ncbi:MAG: hypothetical protein HY094_05795 [Candidatus Melainabacteria bacterium]|nr:hypothetical protein [Candidatus Melainabacteria bacterium]
MIVALGIILVLGFGFVQGSFADTNPLFVTITARESCSTCKKFEPTLQELQNEYDGRITFVTLDLSSKDSIEEAKQTAEEAGITKFFEENKGVVPKVGILCPGGTKTENTFIGETRKEIFEEALDKALLDTSTVCSL